MNREDIIRMAQDAGIIHPEMVDKTLERFAALVASAEREACANICFDAFPSFEGQVCVQLIRARGRSMAKEQA